MVIKGNMINAMNNIKCITSENWFTTNSVIEELRIIA